MGYIRLARGTLAAALSAALVTAALTMGWAPAQAFAPPGDPLCESPSQPGGAPVRILTIGDSITSAAIGDYTWRYFTWLHLMKSNVNVDMVGPTQAISDPIIYDTLTNHVDYVCHFDTDHFAFPAYRLDRYVNTANAGFSSLIQQGMKDADVLIAEIGIEDMIGVGKKTPQQVLTLANKAVTEARSGNPEAKVVLATVATTAGAAAPGSDQANFRTYNDLLTAAYPNPGNPGAVAGVVVARTMSNWGNSNFDLTYDTQHPNVQGEVAIAYQIDKALNLLGIGSSAGAPPTTANQFFDPDIGPAGMAVSPYLGPREPADLMVPVVAGNTTKLTWVLPVGSNNSKVERRDLTTNGAWAQLTALVSPSRSFLDLTGCKDNAGKTINEVPDTSLTPPYTCSASDTTMTGGHTYEYRVRVGKSFTFAKNLTSVVRQVVSTGPTPPVEVVAKTPSAIGHGVTVKWTAVAKATSYKVYYGKSASAITSGPKTVNGGSATSLNVTGLAAATKYYFKVVAHSSAGDAPASNVVSATPAYYVIAAPPKPRLAALARHRIRATWTAAAHTTRYLVQVRLGSRIVKQVFVTRNTWTSGALKKKTTYSVRVRPYDGTYAGGVSRASTVKVK